MRAFLVGTLNAILFNRERRFHDYFNTFSPSLNRSE